MATNVIGLFKAHTDAERALGDLIHHDFDRGDIEIHDPSRTHAELYEELRDRGVPEEDTRLFVSGVQNGHTLLIARTSDERADLARDVMNRHGALDIFGDQARWAHGYNNFTTAPLAASTTAETFTATTATPPPLPATAFASATGSAASHRIDTDEAAVIPIVEEQIAVGKREVESGGARIHTHVVEQPVSESITLHEEHVTVDRHPVNRPAASGDLQDAFSNNTIEVRERAEVPVVAKEARVVEEVTIGKQASEHTHTVSETVRRTDVDVTELDEDDTDLLPTQTGHASSAVR